MKRYAIWNRTDPIITPIGEVLSAEQWIARYPVAGVETITPVVAAGEINGGFFGTLGQMCQMFEAQGCDFSACTTPEEKLETIEAFEDAREAEAAEAEALAREQEVSVAERTARALETMATGETAESTAVMNALLMGEE